MTQNSDLHGGDLRSFSKKADDGSLEWRIHKVLALFNDEVLAKCWAEDEYQKGELSTRPEPVDIEDTANTIIALVEADVAARLLAYGAVSAAEDVIEANTGYHGSEEARDTLQAALNYAGIGAGKGDTDAK